MKLLRGVPVASSGSCCRHTSVTSSLLIGQRPLGLARWRGCVQRDADRPCGRCTGFSGDSRRRSSPSRRLMPRDSPEDFTRTIRLTIARSSAFAGRWRSASAERPSVMTPAAGTTRSSPMGGSVWPLVGIGMGLHLVSGTLKARRAGAQPAPRRRRCLARRRGAVRPVRGAADDHAEVPRLGRYFGAAMLLCLMLTAVPPGLRRPSNAAQGLAPFSECRSRSLAGGLLEVGALELVRGSG